MKKINWDIKGHLAKLRKDLEPMTFREKVDHLWTYYKEYLFVTFMTGLVIAAVIMAICNIGIRLECAGVMSNVSLTARGHDYLTDVFYEDVLGSPKKGKIQLVRSTLYDDITVESTDATYQAYMAVLAMVTGKDLDYMLLERRSFQFYLDEEFYMDLRELLDERELKQLEADEMIIYVQPEGKERIPVGIDLMRLPFGQDCSETDTMLLVFVRNTPRKDTCLRLWEHIKAWKPEE